MGAGVDTVWRDGVDAGCVAGWTRGSDQAAKPSQESGKYESECREKHLVPFRLSGCRGHQRRRSLMVQQLPGADRRALKGP